MKLRKYLVYFLFFAFCMPAVVGFSACQPSYRNMRKFTKKTRAQNKRRKAIRSKSHTNQRATGRPVNTTYILQTKRRTTYHY